MNKIDNTWDEFNSTIGGSKEIVPEDFQIIENTSPREESTPLLEIFENLAMQWRAYDILFIVSNFVRFMQDPDNARSEVNLALQNIIQILADCTSRKYSGLETHVFPRRIGAGIYTFSHVMQMHDSAQLEEAVDSMTNDFPTMFPDLIIRPRERVLALLGSGSKTLLEPLAERIRDGLQPLKWGVCLGGDPHSSSASACLIVNLKGEDIGKLVSADQPPESIQRWHKKAEELWERIKKSD